MSKKVNNPAQIIGSTEELLAHSLAMEKEAVDRFTELAEQMEVHNNHEVADLFYKLAEIEGKHVENVNRASEGRQLPDLLAWEFDWIGQGQSPEGGALEDAHYLMQPWHAIELAMRGEQHAVAFFRHVVNTASDNGVISLARELVAEEEEHVELLRQWQKRFPPPEEGWDDDLDPPTLQE